MLLSVRLQTYNHAAYIEAALQSIEAQVTDFGFEVVIGDDFSADDTPSIIKQFIAQAKNPKISYRLLEREPGDPYWQNRQELGRLYNFTNILGHCTGTYVALLDGDDYWTDPLKLQKQVDFLEENKGYSYCGHKSSVLRNGILTKIPLGVVEFGFHELIFKNVLNTNTLLLRRESIKDIPSFFFNVPAADWALQLLAIKNSRAYILPDYMSVYREHDTGIWSNLDNKTKCLNGVKTQETLKLLYQDTNSKRLIDRAIRQRKLAFGVDKESCLKKFMKRIKLKLNKIFY
ncbi:glycosyltransferase family 2 protein [Gaetbulibacter saemankumensis]|uniref:glycosyltransferase family 2 protein n=1 Tax=Gaetbulibacter saemankumensis TaxID=311208 RepID=UPI00040C9E21|nr:glycosyltransferase [Gaetbulibacter saemankumensis]